MEADTDEEEMEDDIFDEKRERHRRMVVDDK